jgi:glycosyltransferase involved in cell wall biosynthesis
VDRITLTYYDRIIAISHATRDALLATYRLPPGAVQTIYPGVRGLAIEPAPRSGGPFAALYVGGLLPRKNLDVAIKGIARVRARGVDATFTVAGEGPELARLTTLARTSGAGEAVRFVGRIDEARKAALMAAADVFLFPSTLEGFGLAAAEALSAGVPVIGVNRSSIPEVVRDGLTGLLLADSADDEAMAAAIERLARDPSLRRSLGEAGRRDIADRFDPDRAAAAVADAYASVAGRGARS